MEVVGLRRWIGIGVCVVVCGGCVGGASGSTVVDPLPIKVGGLRTDSVEVGVPLVYQRRATGGWRSPVEVRVQVMLTRPIGVSIPLEPNGVVGGVRIRW